MNDITQKVNLSLIYQLYQQSDCSLFEKKIMMDLCSNPYVNTNFHICNLVYSFLTLTWIKCKWLDKLIHNLDIILNSFGSKLTILYKKLSVFIKKYIYIYHVLSSFLSLTCLSNLETRLIGISCVIIATNSNSLFKSSITSCIILGLAWLDRDNVG